MMQKPWFKLFIWTISSSFFFLFSGFLISALGPEPMEQQVMQFMSGMMGAMHNSLMGLSMTIEQDDVLTRIISGAAAMTVPLLITGAILGFGVRYFRRRKDAG